MILSRRSAMLALATGAGVLITGCAGEDPAPTKATPTELEGRPIEPEPDDPNQEGGPVPASASEEDEQAAIAAARATMDVWVQGSTLDQMDWQEQLQATLAPPAQQAYATRYGYKVPDTEVTEEPTILRASVGSAVVRMTTDASTYEVTVVKTGEEWKTSAVTPITGNNGTDQ